MLVPKLGDSGQLSRETGFFAKISQKSLFGEFQKILSQYSLQSTSYSPQSIPFLILFTWHHLSKHGKRKTLCLHIQRKWGRKKVGRSDWCCFYVTFSTNNIHLAWNQFSFIKKEFSWKLLYYEVEQMAVFITIWNFYDPAVFFAQPWVYEALLLIKSDCKQRDSVNGIIVVCLLPKVAYHSIDMTWHKDALKSYHKPDTCVFFMFMSKFLTSFDRRLRVFVARQQCPLSLVHRES